MPIPKPELERILAASFPDGAVAVKSLAGDDDHYEVTVISRFFEGKSRIEQHKMVQKALKDCNIHALSIKTGA